MKFIVKPFSLYQTSTSSYCYTPQASAKLTNSNLVNLLRYVQTNHIDYLQQAELEQLTQQFGLESTPVMKFLIEQVKILLIHDEQRFKHFYLMSDNKNIQAVLFEEFSKHYGLNVIKKDDFNPIKTPQSLVLLFNQAYTESQFKQLYQLDCPADTYFISSYLADKYLIIDNIYNKDKGVPCHFCGLNHLRTTVTTSPDVQNFSWLVFYRNLLKEGLNIIPSPPVTVLTEAFIVSALGKFLKQFLDHSTRELLQDNTSEFWHIDLEKQRFEKEAAIHWPLCECLHG